MRNQNSLYVGTKYLISTDLFCVHKSEHVCGLLKKIYIYTYREFGKRCRIKVSLSLGIYNFTMFVGSKMIVLFTSVYEL